MNDLIILCLPIRTVWQNILRMGHRAIVRSVLLLPHFTWYLEVLSTKNQPQKQCSEVTKPVKLLLGDQRALNMPVLTTAPLTCDHHLMLPLPLSPSERRQLWEEKKCPMSVQYQVRGMLIFSFSKMGIKTQNPKEYNIGKSPCFSTQFSLAPSAEFRPWVHDYLSPWL